MISILTSAQGGGRISTINYRTAVASDASSIGAVHVTAWRETYSGLLPENILNNSSVESRAAMWASVLNTSAGMNKTQVYIAENAIGIIGFGACGGQRDDDIRRYGFPGEIGAIYILQSQQRAGVGLTLINLMGRDLVARSMLSASLWVLRENLGARCFYEGLGGRIIVEKEVKQDDTSLHKVAYGWPDLACLISATSC